jgi:hypothetical protein
MNFCIVVARYNENLEWTKNFLNVIVYNKGNPLSDDFNQKLLNNLGREGHTYYTIFLQGNPFDHSPNIISNLNKYVNNTNLSIDFEFLSECVLDCNLTDCRHHSGLPLIDTYEKIFGERNKNMEFKFGAGAQFIVSKKKILQRPKEFYLKIIEMLNKDINPIEGFVIERFHKLIFN